MTDSLAPVPLNDLARGIARDEALLLEAMRAVLASGYVIQGPQHAAFEAELADYLGTGYALGLASGTDALELAIRASMPAGRSTVLTAANAGGYTTTAARRAGFSVAYVDVNPTTLCIDADTVEAGLLPDVGVVVITHLYGYLTDFSALLDLCRSRNVRVVEDCAQSVGATRNGARAGSLGDIAAISFYPTKNLGALGDGGAIVTNDEGLATTVRSLRQYGWAGKYHVELPGGVNSRLDELQAAFLRIRLPMLDDFNQARRAIVAKYRLAAAALPGTLIQIMPATGKEHVAHLAVALSERREEIRAQLAKKGIQTDVHFPIPDYDQPGFGGPPASGLPVTSSVATKIFSLPCFPEMTEDEVARVCSAIEELS